MQCTKMAWAAPACIHISQLAPCRHPPIALCRLIRRLADMAIRAGDFDADLEVDDGRSKVRMCPSFLPPF